MSQAKNQRVAFITGGSRGIGRGIVKKLALEHQISVAFTYLKEKGKAEELVQELKDQGCEALAIQADNQNVEALKKAIEKTAKHFHKIDILVNNAGIGIVQSIENLTLAEFDHVINVNLKAAFVAIQSVLPLMQNQGRIINIGSVLADRVPFPGLSLYAMSKGALASFTRGLARDLAPKDITVNTVQPGLTKTDMNTGRDEGSDFFISMTTLGRYGTVEEIASVVAYLTTPEANFITGATFDVDGGITA